MQAHRSSATQKDSRGFDRVVRAAQRVQAMPPLRRALLAREALVTAAGESLAFGPAEARLRSILARTGRVGMVIISFGMLIARILAGRRASARSGAVPEAIFIGIDAPREEKLRKNVAAETGCLPLFVDQRSPAGFAPLPAPQNRRVLQNWRCTIRVALSISSAADSEFSPLDLLSSLTIRCHEIAYLVALFEELYIVRPDTRLIFSTADIAAHAACIAGIEAEYHQHGLLSRSLVFPAFSTMVALTNLEGRHVAARVPGLMVKVRAPRRTQDTSHSILALVGDYGAIDPGPVTSLVDLAMARGVEVVVRPHPRGTDAPWAHIRGREKVRFEFEGDFDEFLARWRPAFLATWFSTTLVDGLLAGALPITFSSGQSPLVLPLDDIAVAFPQKRELVEACMTDPAQRMQLHETLMKVVRP